MKKNLKTLTIIFSVVLNIVFITSYLYHELGLFNPVSRQANYDHPLYKELDLDRDQLDRLKPLGDSFHTFVNEQGRKIKDKQLELVYLLAKDDPDHRAIEAKQKDIQTLQHEMQSRVIEHLLEESRIFTPKQRQRFFALVEKRIKKSDSPRPRWMPQRQAKPSKENRP